MCVFTYIPLLQHLCINWLMFNKVNNNKSDILHIILSILHTYLI